ISGGTPVPLSRTRISTASPGSRVDTLSPSPRLRGEGWGEGLLFEFRQQRLENAIEILDHIIVPDTDHPITERAKYTIAVPIVAAFRVLASVELDNQAPFAANKVDVILTDWLLADKFEAAQLPAAKTRPQYELCGREGAPQRSRPFIV